jgi:ubiquinol-cytochrome c reductase cytochrome c subunit
MARAETSVLAGCVLAGGLLFAVVWLGGGDRGAAAVAPAASAPDAKAVYLSDCAVCHGADGRGTTTGPSLVGVGAASANYQLTTGRMPLSAPGAIAHRQPPKYDQATIEGLEAIVAGFGAGPAVPELDLSGADVAAGGEIYRLNCAACHQAVGQGGALEHREAPPLTEATPTQIAEAVRLGPGQMPSFGHAAIDDKGLADLAAYVTQQLQHPNDAGGLAIGHLGPVPEGAIAIIVGLGLAVLITIWIGDREPTRSVRRQR